jgi:hypothetical protein
MLNFTRLKNSLTEIYTMRHIKNFFHNINDIVLATIIVVAAVLIILWRIQVILDYPKTVITDQVVTEESVSGEEAAEEAPADEPAENAEEASSEEPAENAEEAPAEDAEEN